MGFITSIFGAIFGLIGGIFKAIGGLVGLGKKSEFYLELDEADSVSKSAPAVQPVATVSTKPAAATPAVASASVSVAAAPVAKPAQPAGPVPSFAANYVADPGATAPTRRRRPGPSLSPFMDMAKTVKVR